MPVRKLLEKTALESLVFCAIERKKLSNNAWQVKTALSNKSSALSLRFIRGVAGGFHARRSSLAIKRTNAGSILWKSVDVIGGYA